MAGPADIGVGLAGYGLAGRSFHAPFLATVPGLRLAAIATQDPSRRAHARAEHPEAALVRSADELIDRPDVQLVVVAAPNSLHAPLATRALQAGRHVVVDKPIALSVPDAEELVEVADRSGRLLTVFQNRRWDGDFLTLRRLIAEGRVGDVDSLETRFERFTGVGPEWRELAHEAGGPLRDLGTHLVDQALVLFGPARRVWAQIDRRRPAGAVEDSVFLAIDHANGVHTRAWTSLIASRPGPRLRLRGLAGEYVKEGLDIQESQLVSGMSPNAPGFGVDPPERWGTLHLGNGTSAAVQTERGRYAAFYEGLRDAIGGGTQPPVEPRDVIVGLRLLEAAERAASTGAVQILGEA